MAIRHLNYTAIPLDQRRKTGQRLLLQYRDQLRNPTLTEEQRALIQAQIDKVNGWISGTLKT